MMLLVIVASFVIGGSYGNPDRINSITNIGYFDGKPSQIDLAKIPGRSLEGNHLYLASSIQDNWIELVSRALKDGHNIDVNYAFRTNKQQKRLYRKNRRLATAPGWSHHQQGIAIDISGCVKRIKTKRGRVKKVKTPLYYWLVANGPRYGFENTAPHEPWHWEFVGTSS